MSFQIEFETCTRGEFAPMNACSQLRCRWQRSNLAVFDSKSHRVGPPCLTLFVCHNNFAVCLKLLILLVIGHMFRSKRREVVGYENPGGPMSEGSGRFYKRTMVQVLR